MNIIKIQDAPIIESDIKQYYLGMLNARTELIKMRHISRKRGVEDGKQPECPATGN